VVVPGGFGVRGIEGKINAVRFARENDIPFLGLCLGLQCAVIEFSRSQLGLIEANSAEFDPMTPTRSSTSWQTQKGVEDLGGTMRLGLYPARLDPKSRPRELYGEDVIYERHRHRYEVNNRYRQDLEAAGLLMAGVSPDDQLVEVIELPSHPFFVASQFHPEFKSRPDDPHPLFAGFMRAAAERVVEAPGAVVDLPQAAVDRR
jgi:CTP synthase